MEHNMEKKYFVHIKGLVHPTMKIKSLLLTPMLYQPRKTFVHLRNTNKDIFD